MTGYLPFTLIRDIEDIKVFFRDGDSSLSLLKNDK